MHHSHHPSILLGDFNMSTTDLQDKINQQQTLLTGLFFQLMVSPIS